MRTALAATVAATTLLGALGAAHAQDVNGRFTMSPTPEGGYLKLDTRTGDVSQCLREGAGFRCTLVPDERSALQQEIDRLTKENGELRARLGSAAPAPSPAPVPGVAPPPAQLPSDADVDRALSIMEKFFRRFRDIMREQDEGKPL